MRTTIRKWYWIWSIDKEEKWLNEMAEKGLSLFGVGFCSYTFEQSLPGEYHVRLELLENGPTHAESEYYIKFLEETDAEYIGSVNNAAYFRKKQSIGVFDLYSDYDSRIKSLNRILQLLAIIFMLEIFIGFFNLSLYLNLDAEILSFNLLNINLVLSFVLFGVALIIGYGFLRINSKKCKLQKEKILFE